MLCADGGRDGSDMSTSQGMPRVAGNDQKLGKGNEGFFPSTFRRSMALPVPDFRILAPRTVRFLLF